MTATVQLGPLEVDSLLHDFVGREALSGTGVDERHFWTGLASLIGTLGAVNHALLETRARLQAQIDQWHRQHPGPGFDRNAYEAFLRQIGYLQVQPADFTIDTAGVDPEIATIAGPQLVVPVSNARYALNAANARWGSLYDALYGTDVISEAGGAQRTAGYNPVRGAAAVAFGRGFLDASFPLTDASHRQVAAYVVNGGRLQARLHGGRAAALVDPGQFIGFQGAAAAPDCVLLRNHGLHVQVRIDRSSAIGAADSAGVRDIVLEAAVTTIQDFEDSIAAVDAADKVSAYRNWLGLMNGTLTAQFDKGGRPMTRRLAADPVFTGAEGGTLTLPGRSLMLVRNVGHHMMTRIVLYQGQPVPETFIDAAVTALIALHDLRGGGALRNSRAGSVYIVKPKMHGAAEVACADTLFAGVEDLLGMPRHTLKIGIMDEERRTSVNLKACIHAARRRLAFINTGFLDRTGDEIHTSMEAGVVVRKAVLKQAAWLEAYERRNVATGLRCGLAGRAQIGKGMWAMPDLMAAMLAGKIAHPQAGASTAWVPSPTAATLHALHYHQVDVAAVQLALSGQPDSASAPGELLAPPLQDRPQWTPAQVNEELDNNAQSILGYVVRWIDAGVGCSKVPDLYNVALMEDRATLRISSQHVANWLHHGICSGEQVRAALLRMAKVVDTQNAAEPGYRPMHVDPEHSVAFQAACDLVLHGREQPNGYTEAILHARRLQAKRRDINAHSTQL